MRQDVSSGAPSSAADEWVRGRHWWLFAILVTGLVFRFWRLSWGLPDFEPPDSVNYYIRPAARLVAAGELVQSSFIHTPIFVYTIGLIDFVWSRTVGGPIDLGPRMLQDGLGSILPSGRQGLLGPMDMPPQVATLVLLARGYSALTATLSLGVLYLLARRMVGVRAALLATAVFALSPLHVLESHRANADGLMILLALVTAHRAVVALQRGRPRGLLAAFAVAGVTAAVRYNGLAIATLPAWVAITWPVARASMRVGLLFRGSLVLAFVLAIGLLPAAFNWERFLSQIVTLFSTGFVTGGNLDLSGEGWVFNRYVYQLVAVFPYALGWPAYLCSLVGLFLLARSSPRSFGILLAAIVPFFLVHGASRTVEPRYFQFLIPFLALAAGVTLDTLVAARRRFGIAFAVLVLGYTAMLAGSHSARLGRGPQRAVADLLHARAQSATEAGRTLGIAYPGPIDLLFDPVRTQVQDPTIRLHHLPHVVDERSDPSSSERLSDEQLAENMRQWVATMDVDVVVLPSWQEGVVLRSGRTDSNAARVYRYLGDGTLPFRQVAHFRDGFFTERLYIWPDPLLNGHRATGILGYKVFVKTAEASP